MINKARTRLHHIMAAYLGDPLYNTPEDPVMIAARSGNQQLLRESCIGAMQCHASTRERIPYLDEFYTRIFVVTSQPKSIIDVACALHPLGIPWMNLAPDTLYYAYDIHRPRVDYLNRFFRI